MDAYYEYHMMTCSSQSKTGHLAKDLIVDFVRHYTDNDHLNEGQGAFFPQIYSATRSYGLSDEYIRGLLDLYFMQYGFIAQVPGKPLYYKFVYGLDVFPTKQAAVDAEIERADYLIEKEEEKAAAAKDPPASSSADGGEAASATKKPKKKNNNNNKKKKENTESNNESGYESYRDWMLALYGEGNQTEGVAAIRAVADQLGCSVKFQENEHCTSISFSNPNNSNNSNK